MSEEIITVTTEDKQALFDVIVEITAQLTIQDEAKAKINDIASGAQDTFGIKKKYFPKLAKVMHNSTFDDVRKESSDFESLYELIIGERKEYSKE